MDIYLVGGAVRDKFLDYPVKERDWVVVGGSEQQMTDAGYRKVGRDFPVFLHPKTQEEYALARTERKTGSGYIGFSCDSSTGVTLEQDLQRRDLTINAMALDTGGELVDPYGGQVDLKNRLLRHVSPAFTEDPLRVLRVARFAARYHHLGFRVADETMALMQQMVEVGEIEHLVAERVWQEMAKALAEQHPAQFICTLRSCGALAVLLPELDQLFGVPQPEKYHPEIDTGVHVLLALEVAVTLTPFTATRFAVLMHDLGKGLTPKSLWPSHLGHEKKGLQPLRAICQRLKVPKQHAELAELAARHHMSCHRIMQMRPVKLMELFSSTDALRRPERFHEFLLACEADARGRAGLLDQPYPQGAFLRKIITALQNLNSQELISQGYSGKQLGDKIRQQQIETITNLLAQEKSL